MSRLSFDRIGLSKSGKTEVWAVWSNHVEVGTISWYAQWRRYVFYPLNSRLFDSECLKELTTFLDRTNKEHKEK